MSFVRNFPLFMVIFCLVSGTSSTIMKKESAKLVNFCLISIVGIMSAIVAVYCYQNGSFTYMMGHFPAPWGNEVRGGVLEGLMGCFFSIIMLFSMMGGYKKLFDEVELTKHNLYYVLVDLLLCSLIALVYTNDLFNAYVFVEINTIAACGLIMIRQNGRTLTAAIRYMVMSLLGSGLFLMGICITYDVTGHLLMSNIQQAFARIELTGTYELSALVGVVLMVIGLCIKSALFPFHTWLPDAYGYSTVSSAAILSSLVSKAYIFLLIKIFYRVIGIPVLRESDILNVLYVFGLVAMIAGSVSAIRENDIRRMIAFSSVAQIGYIYMGFGLVSVHGFEASVYHILAHAATKSLLFIAAIGLTDVSRGSRKFADLTGSAHRNRIAGAGFLVGSLSMVGIPLFSGFISKLLYMRAAFDAPYTKMFPALIVLGISTILNAVYFMKSVLRIYTPTKTQLLYNSQSDIDEHSQLLISEKRVGINGMIEQKDILTFKDQKLYGVVVILFIALNILLGVFSNNILNLIRMGLEMFS